MLATGALCCLEERVSGRSAAVVLLLLHFPLLYCYGFLLLLLRTAFSLVVHSAYPELAVLQLLLRG